MSVPAPTGHKKGMLAEWRAAAYLRLRGYRILVRRYKTRAGEIDIVALRGNLLVFAEVKRRRDMATGAEAIHARNQLRVRQAAELYLQAHPQYNDCDMRFDALIVTPARLVTHIEAAWM
jgi:putative endonuclease